MSFRRFIFKRIMFLIPTFIGVTAAIFIVMNVVGNPIAILLQRGHSAYGGYLYPEQFERMKQLYGLDKPVWERYFIWLFNILHGEFGFSFFQGRDVLGIILDYLPFTLELQVLALIETLMIAIPMGVYAALNQYSKVDFGFLFLVLLGASLPFFWFALLLLILFSGYLGWLPSFGAFSLDNYLFGNVVLDHLWHLILPVNVMCFVSLAYVMRVIRENMLEIIKEDYIIALKALGLKNRVIIFKHALRAAILPIVAQLGPILGSLVIGSSVVETIFGWPGIGFLFVKSLLNMDFPVSMGIIVIYSIIVLAGNLISDVLHAIIDRRVTLE